jgi:hypothetical protein
VAEKWEVKRQYLNTFHNEKQAEELTLLLDNLCCKNKYMVTSNEQNKRRSHNTKIGATSFEMKEELKYLGTLLTKQNSIQEEMKNRLKSRNA